MGVSQFYLGKHVNGPGNCAKPFGDKVKLRNNNNNKSLMVQKCNPQLYSVYLQILVCALHGLFAGTTKSLGRVVEQTQTLNPSTLAFNEGEVLIGR
jgi:hypothetical protein